MNTGKKVKSGIASIFIAALLAFAGCDNYFHELIPPDGNRIISFSVEGQVGSSEITDDTVTATVDGSFAVESLVPIIKISRKAKMIPLTLEYLETAFPNVDRNEIIAIYGTPSGELTSRVIDLIKRTPGFNIPVIDKPIDFSGPVNFLVISGQGNIRRYTVNVVIDNGEPRLLGFTFSKYDNPELIRDAITSINESAKTVSASILYPAEMQISYALIPSFEILGDKLVVDGAEIQSGVDAIQLYKILGSQNKTITIWRNGLSADFTLTTAISEDPDSVRSITDFRFNKAANTGIAATAVGSIVKNDHLGTIRVQVFYSGARPSNLTPAFISPGTVSVNGVTQTSGVSNHDFSQTIEYRVVSRNNQFTRTYTVYVELIDIVSASPEISSFKFSSLTNHELVQDSLAHIGGGTIMIEARYGGDKPDLLTPEFSATGLVTVMGAVQTSSFSAQDFTRQVKYTVTNPENPLFTRDYWVQVTFVRDTSSEAKISFFSFHPDENSVLADEITGRIDQIAGTITVYAPIGSGITARTAFPRFTALGQVFVSGTVQESGASGQNFNAPVVYDVVSANGNNSKSYTVTVRELQSTIYVNQNAFGMGDGANWTDAFRNLHDACEAAAQFPDDVPKEIWIAAGTYKPSAAGNVEEYLLLAANTSYIGGFAGNETAKSQRNVAANKVIISGDLGGGKYSNNLFGSFNGNTTAAVNGDLSFEDMEFASARAAGTDDRANGAAVNASLSTGSEMRIRNCSFNDLQSTFRGGAVCVNGGNLVISSVQFENTTASVNTVSGMNISGLEMSEIKMRNVVKGSGFYFSGSYRNIDIKNVDLQNISGYGIYLIDCSGDIDISDIDLQDISGNGIYISGGSGRRDLSNITGNRISGTYGIYVSDGGAVTLTNSNFDTCGGVYVSGSGSSVNVSDTKTKNIYNNNAIYTSGGNIVIERVNVENVSGRGIYIYSSGTVQINGSSIKNCTSGVGGGIYLGGSGSAVISGTTIENVEAIESSYGGGGGIYMGTGVNLTVRDSTIKNAKTNYNGGGICYNGTGSVVISGTTIEDVEANNRGGGIYCTGRLTIFDSVIKNAKAVGNGGGIYIDSSDTVISGIIIENTETLSNGGGIFAFATNSMVQITDSSIKNAKAANSGGGIHYDGSGSMVISGIIIENVEAAAGGGISAGSSAVAINGMELQITGSSIKNAKATNGGGGIYLIGPGNAVISGTTIENVEATNGGGIYLNLYASQTNSLRLVINDDSRFENCRANNQEGAIRVSSRLVSYEITNTTFLNCTARNGEKFMDTTFVTAPVRFMGCIFEDNDALYNYDTPTTTSTNPMFGTGEQVYFEGCTFNNLRSSMANGNFIFNGSTGYVTETYMAGATGFPGYRTNNKHITLSNCTFNFQAGSAGLCAMASEGSSNNYLLVDGVTINNNGGQKPIFWFHGNYTPGIFRFKANNIYNGITLNTAVALTGLGSNVVKLTGGARPTMVP